jgi:hypothetical protein
MTSPDLVYRNNPLRITVGVFALLTTGIFIGQAFSPGKGGAGLQVLSSLCAVASASVVVRALVGPSISASPNGVLVRTLFRTRRFPWAEIERFQARTGRVGRSVSPRRILGIALKDGQTIWFSELNARTKTPGWVDEAVLRLNSYARPASA